MLFCHLSRAQNMVNIDAYCKSKLSHKLKKKTELGTCGTLLIVDNLCLHSVSPYPSLNIQSGG